MQTFPFSFVITSHCDCKSQCNVLCCALVNPNNSHDHTRMNLTGSSTTPCIYALTHIRTHTYTCYFNVTYPCWLAPNMFILFVQPSTHLNGTLCHFLQLMNNPELLRQLMENPMMQVSNAGHHHLSFPCTLLCHIIAHRSLYATFFHLPHLSVHTFCSSVPSLTECHARPGHHS